MSLRYPVNEKDHCMGNPNAPIQLLEYGDYQCPYCGQAYPIVKQLQQHFGNDIYFIFRNFPLANIHPHAKLAAIASEAAARQNKYWEMHDSLFENQKRLNLTSIIGYAEELQLDLFKFRVDVTNPTLEEHVESDFYGGMRSGVSQTPTFFINGEKYTGSWEQDPFIQHLQTLM